MRKTTSTRSLVVKLFSAFRLVSRLVIFLTGLALPLYWLPGHGGAAALSCLDWD